MHPPLFPRCPKPDWLANLDLSGCGLLSDGDLHDLLDVPVKGLNLRSCRRLSDIGLEALGGMKTLTVLNLGRCNRISAAGLRQLQKLPLRKLSLRDCRTLTPDALLSLQVAAGMARKG